MKQLKKKKGFTLVELIITIAIIVVIFGIATTSIINVINNSKEKSETLAKNNILSAARIYAQDPNNNVTWQKNIIEEKEKEKFACVSINELINKNLLKKEFEDKSKTYANYIVVWKSKNNSISTEELYKKDINNNTCKYVESKIISNEIQPLTTLCQENNYYTGEYKNLLNKNSNIYGITYSMQKLGYSETNIIAKEIGDYEITATLSENYMWKDGTTEPKYFTCSILAPKYFISYNPNKGTGTMTDSQHTYGENSSLTPNKFTKTGYTFANWNTSADNTKALYENEASSNNFKEKDIIPKNNETINLYAIWNPITYTITYNGNGNTSGQTTNSTHTYDEAKTLNSNGFAKTGYTFNGWNTKADGTGTKYNNGQSVTNLTSSAGTTITLYAQWTANAYTINYDGNGNTGGSTASSSHIINTSKNLTANGFTRTGYIFTEWTTNKDGSGQAYLDKQSVKNLTTTANETITLYAQWEPITYTITYNGNNNTSGQTANSSHTYDIAKTLTANGFTRTGYTFNGWNTKADGTGTSYSDKQSITNLSSTNASTVTLYAKWKAKTYTVTLNPNGGTVSTTSTQVTYNSTYGTLPEPARENYSFNGWFTSSTGGTKITQSSKVTITANQTLYAQWTATTTTINDTRYTCQKYNNESSYRLSLFYVTTCNNATGICNYNKLNGLTSSTIDTSMMVFTPSWTIEKTSLSTSIDNNCKSTWYVKTKKSTGMNCRAGASANTDRVTGVAECAAIKVSRTTTKFDTKGNNWFYFPAGDCYLAGAYLYTSQQCSNNTGNTSTNIDPKLCGKCSSDSDCGSAMSCSGTCVSGNGTYKCCKSNKFEMQCN